MSLTYDLNLNQTSSPKGAFAWLPSPPNVMKVQLPTLYLRNLDNALRCATVEQEAASATAEDLCPHPPPKGRRSVL